MAKREQRRLEEIERDLLDDSKSLATALRKAVTLGGELKSVPLREWASRELRGYEDGQDGKELPDYRRVSAPLLIDGATMRGIVKRQQLIEQEHTIADRPHTRGLGRRPTPFLRFSSGFCG